MLARAGALAAAYAFFVANAGPAEATWLAHEMQARFQVRLARLVQTKITAMWDSEAPTTTKDALEMLKRQVAYAVARHREALGTLNRLWLGIGPLARIFGEEAAQAAQKELERAHRAADDRSGALGADGLSEPPEEADEWEEKAAAMTPRRLYRGPVSFGALSYKLSPEARAAWRKLVESRRTGGRTSPTLAEYWANGRRSGKEIVDLVEMETGIRDAELIVRRFELLHQLGVLDL